MFVPATRHLIRPQDQSPIRRLHRRPHLRQLFRRQEHRRDFDPFDLIGQVDRREAAERRRQDRAVDSGRRGCTFTCTEDLDDVSGDFRIGRRVDRSVLVENRALARARLIERIDARRRSDHIRASANRQRRSGERRADVPPAGSHSDAADNAAGRDDCEGSR